MDAYNKISVTWPLTFIYMFVTCKFLVISFNTFPSSFGPSALTTVASENRRSSAEGIQTMVFTQADERTSAKCLAGTYVAVLFVLASIIVMMDIPT